MPYIVALVALLMSPMVFAEDSINDQMRRIADAMLVLLPQVHDRSADHVRLREDVGRLRALVDDASDHVAALPAGSRVNYSMLQRELARAATSLDNGSEYLARGALASAFELCAGCHAQDGVARPAFGVSRLRELDEYLAGEYGYLTRDYAGAAESYLNFLREPAGDGDRQRRADALLRMLSLQLERGSEPRSAVTWLERLPRQVPLTPREAEAVSSWRDVIDRATSTPPGLVSPQRAESIAALDHLLANEWPDIRFVLDYNSQQAWWLLVRHRLDELIAKAPEGKDLPVALYWLAVSDRQLYYRFYESLPAQYLETCIRDYPAHPYARTCYDEYELLMVVAYSGSGGLRLPQDVIDQLNELQAIVRGPPKRPQR